MCGLPSNMKNSSHEMWQTSLLFLKPLQIQNLKRKKWGEHGILCPPIWKRGGTRVSHQVAPMLVFDFRLFTATRCRPCKKHPTFSNLPLSSPLQCWRHCLSQLNEQNALSRNHQKQISNLTPNCRLNGIAQKANILKPLTSFPNHFV